MPEALGESLGFLATCAELALLGPSLWVHFRALFRRMPTLTVRFPEDEDPVRIRKDPSFLRDPTRIHDEFGIGLEDYRRRGLRPLQ